MGINSGRSIARRWYPSGPRLDGKRSEDYYVASTMPDVNPNPDKWEIHDAKEINNYLVVKIKYPNCTNYEGVKILVYKDMTLLNLIKQKKIDPHFFQDKKFQSPIARFVPDDSGWEMALLLCQTLTLNKRQIKS